MATVVEGNLFYIDGDGNTGSAMGLVMFDVDTLSESEKAEYESLKEDGNLRAIRQWALGHSHHLDALEGFRYITSAPIKRVMEGKGGRELSHLVVGEK